MPGQFMNRGDRLVFSNGIIILSAFAGLLIYVFNADLNRLIQLYLVGVFVSFTLSQTGMVLRWRKIRTRGWQRSLSISAVGAIATGTVLVVVVVTKFVTGAWIVVTAIPIFMYIMYSIHRHYTDAADQLGRPERRPPDARPGNQHMVVLVERVDAAAARAVGYVRSIRPRTAAAVTLEPDCHNEWNRLAPEIELTTLTGEGSDSDLVKRYIRERRSTLSSDDFLTLVIPEVLETRSLFEIVRRPKTHRLKASLLTEPGVQVLDIPMVKEDIKPRTDWAHEPARNYVVVLISKVNNPSLHAIEYAETLRPTDLGAVSFGLDPESTEQLGDDWLEAGVPHPLEIEDSPFRDIGQSLKNYIRQFGCDGFERVVTVVIPEFVVEKKRHQLLHGQSGLIVKRHLLFEPGVVVVSIPYHLTPTDRTTEPAGVSGD
jgi:hypothetical protein